MKTIKLSATILSLITILTFSACKKDDNVNASDPNLVAEFLFSANTNDTGAFNFKSKASNVTFTFDRKGLANFAAVFSGDSSYVQIANADQLNFNNNFTLCAWIKVSGFKPNGYKIIDKAVGSSGLGFVLDTYTRDLTGNQPRFICGGNDVYYSGSTLQTGQWYFIVSTYQNGVGNIYVNGQLVSTHQSASTTMATSTTPLRIGFDTGVRIGPDLDDSFVGVIDDVRIYNKVLTQGEITDLYIK